MDRAAEVVIVGAGIAGATVAYHLAKRGCRDLLILERETSPGYHASGRNAAMLRQAGPSPLNTRFARESRRFFETPPEPFGGPLFHPTGSYLLVSGPQLKALAAEIQTYAADDIEVQIVPQARLLATIPLIDLSGVEGIAWTSTDGVLDIHTLLQGFLQGAVHEGARLEAGVAVQALSVEGKRITGVMTDRGAVRARLVVNAAGAWAGPLGAAAGAPLPLRPCRRHLAVTEPLPGVSRDWPIVWDDTDPFYFRPESGGLLMSPCDVEAHPPADVQPSPSGVELTAAKASRLLPALASVGLSRVWACLRTLTPDDHFVIGPDPRLDGLFWVAGLGGHGMSASPLIGLVAADLILEKHTTLIDPSLVSPARFL